MFVNVYNVFVVRSKFGFKTGKLFRFWLEVNESLLYSVFRNSSYKIRITTLGLQAFFYDLFLDIFVTMTLIVLKITILWKVK